MSIFERKLINKVYLDDTVSISATIINAESVQGHTEYVIRVQRGLLPENSWHIQRRYNDFLSLHQEFQADGISLPFPPKKIIGNMDREFIAERQVALQKYLDVILQDPLFSSQLGVKKFLDPHNYKFYHALGQTQMCIKLRGELDVKIVKQLPHLGWRLRKEHYLVTLEPNNKEEYILTWTPFGPDKFLDEKQILSVLKSFASLQHINIIPITKVGICKDGGWVIKQAKKCGSVLDMMYGVKSPYFTSALRKYRSVELKNLLPVPKVIEIASQILQILTFLHHNGVYHGHLHLGNVTLDGDVVKLLDLENSLFALPSYYRESFVKVKQIQSMQAIDVYSFGLIIYEMLFGKPFTDVHLKEITECPPVFKSVLESILCPRSKAALPTVTDLLNSQIFHQGPPAPQPLLKLTSSSKQHLLSNGTKLLERLNEDQVKYRQNIRTKKMYGMLNYDGKLVVCFKDKAQIKEDNEINGSIDISNKAESISSKDSSKNSGCSEEKLTSPPLIEDEGRSALLGAICNFNKNKLKRVDKHSR
ncbi:PX domain-containing protein kinase-like protein [Cimex lectularius]|uniref:PX domain-containing protein kinase-like protein n=1 Tax=Cimex lectularius TaxID=79782 RepID=A0A8I6RD20_CIMLE|nr:PX domain-containing protein kinase-like protein [Cimex lectularius]